MNPVKDPSRCYRKLQKPAITQQEPECARMGVQVALLKESL